MASPRYTPTPTEVKERREAAGLTLQACADLCLVDLRTWQRWEQQPGAAGHRPMAPPMWLLFNLQLERLQAGRKTRRAAE